MGCDESRNPQRPRRPSCGSQRSRLRRQERDPRNECQDAQGQDGQDVVSTGPKPRGGECRPCLYFFADGFDMTDIVALVARHGYLLVGVIVFAESIGLPVPAALALIAGGTAASSGTL